MVDDIAASIILEQLGGNKFLAMTGATPLTYNSRSIDFKLNGKHPTLGQVNRMRIELAYNDTYTVTIFRLRNLVCKQLDQKDGIFADTLRLWIENLTGLRTRL
jgi:hypothetical protein